MFLAMAAGTIAFALAFLYPAIEPQAVIWYAPVDHRWSYELKPSGVATDFYGRTLQVRSRGVSRFS